MFSITKITTTTIIGLAFSFTALTSNVAEAHAPTVTEKAFTSQVSGSAGILSPVR